MKKRSVKQLIFITIFIFCLGFMAAIAMNKSNSNSFLQENGNLIAELEFKDGQSGFVGISGTTWTILPDGTCRGSRFINTHLAPCSETGFIESIKP